MSEDAQLLHKVKEALEKQEGLDLSRVHLRVVGKVVFVDGEVPDEASSETLETTAKAVAGIRWVQNRLQIDAADTPAERDPHHHE